MFLQYLSTFGVYLLGCSCDRGQCA